jgi:hypothetical protein
MAVKQAEAPRYWYRVTAPLITVKTGTPQGMRVVGLNVGAPLPFDVSDASLQHHISHDLVESYPLAGPEAVALAQARGLPMPKVERAPEPETPEPVKPEPAHPAGTGLRATPPGVKG